MNRFRVVLCEPTLPENIGAAARAMHTMGLQELYLVAPKEWPSKAAFAVAKGGGAVLEKLKIASNLKSAIEGAQAAVALTARTRDYIPLLPLKEGLPKILKVEGNIALVFGRESSGLTNEELLLCNIAMTIPANPDYPVLNLAQAVMIVCYELRNWTVTSKQSPPKQIAPLKAYWSVFDRLEAVLAKIHLANDSDVAIVQKFKALLWECEFDEQKMALLHLFLKRVQKKLDGEREPDL